jgi:hypothetical protein
MPSSFAISATTAPRRYGSHPGRQEQHVRSAYVLGDLLAILERSLASDLGIGAGTQALGDAGPELKLNFRLVRLSACASYWRNELHPCTPGRHMIHRISAATSDITTLLTASCPCVSIFSFM